GGVYRDPSGQATFRLPLQLNDRGEVLFDAVLTGGTNTRGVFRGTGDHTTTIALGGANAPGTTGTFSSFRDFKLLNDGRVVFLASLTIGVGGVNFANSLGLWIGTSEDDLQLVARTGDVIEGKTLTNFPS